MKPAAGVGVIATELLCETNGAFDNDGDIVAVLVVVLVVVDVVVPPGVPAGVGVTPCVPVGVRPTLAGVTVLVGVPVLAADDVGEKVTGGVTVLELVLELDTD